MATQFTHSFMSTPTARAGDILRLEGISRTFGVRRVIDGFSLLVPPGARLGLLGENGAGKSTLLRIAAGADSPDAGTVTVPRRRGLASAGLLAQEVRAPRHWSLRDLLDDALFEFRALERDLEAAALALADGGEQALLVTTEMPEVRGVAIVCEGGDSEAINEKIENAVTAALDITSKRVYIAGGSYDEKR